MKDASSKISGAKVSLKHSLVLCKKLRGKSLAKSKSFLEDLRDQKISIDGKYYSKAADKFLEMLGTVEMNAKQKNLNTERLFIRKIQADKGLVFQRPRSLWHLRGQKAKSVNLVVEVEER